MVAVAFGALTGCSDLLEPIPNDAGGPPPTDGAVVADEVGEEVLGLPAQVPSELRLEGPEAPHVRRDVLQLAEAEPLRGPHVALFQIGRAHV